MKHLVIVFFSVFYSVIALSFTEGLVQPGSVEEAAISNSIQQILTTETGCILTERLFFQRANTLQLFFGITENASKNIVKHCSGKDLPAFSFFRSSKFKRQRKTYQLHKTNDQLQGWTTAENTSHIYINSLESNQLRRILAHELMITMDDKFYLDTKIALRFNFPVKAPPQIHCSINRFLKNPFYQSILASLRAYSLEVTFATELKDQDWLNELKSYDFLDDNTLQNFENFKSQMAPFQISIVRFYKNYFDDCTGSVQAIADFSDDDIAQMIEYDWQVVKTILNAKNLESLMNFLIGQFAISASDENAINFGPRPVIAPTGWSKETFNPAKKLLVPERNPEVEKLFNSTVNDQRQTLTLDDLKKSSVPTKKIEMKPQPERGVGDAFRP